MKLEELIPGEMKMVNETTSGDPSERSTELFRMATDSRSIPLMETEPNKLRQRFEGEMKEDMFQDDSVFQRFLRARNHDMDEAEYMLRNHVNWRKTSNVDLLLTDYNPAEVLTKYVSMTPIGFSKEGLPLTYIQFGNLDTRGLLKSVTGQDICTYIMRHLERDVSFMKERSDKMEKHIHQFIYIFDFENIYLSLVTHRPTIDVIINIVQLYEANFPERLHICFFINASFYFTLIWALIKPFLSGPTVQKIHIYGKDGYQNDLLHYIGADVLPKFLGGNKTDPDGDPMCKSMITFGGTVPESYYVKKKPASIPGGKKAVVSRMSKMELKFEVLFPGSNIQWEFLVKAGDIQFSLLHKTNANGSIEVKELIPKQRIETEAGVYTCNETGVYILEFDNTYSWLHNKEIHYTATLSKPHQHSSK